MRATKSYFSLTEKEPEVYRVSVTKVDDEHKAAEEKQIKDDKAIKEDKPVKEDQPTDTDKAIKEDKPIKVDKPINKDSPLKQDVVKVSVKSHTVYVTIFPTGKILYNKHG